jgi:pilus assembly protein CpaF
MIPEHVYEEALRAFLEPVRPFLDDETVTEILVNGPNEIFVERRGKLVRTGARFPSSEKLIAVLRLIAQYVGRPVDDQRPILEARLPDGSRVEALLPCIAKGGPSVAIRRFSRETLTLKRLLDLGAISPDAVETLRALIECKQNVVVAGGTGSGKTSLLNALSVLVPAGERIIVLEDARELSLQRDHVVQLEARPADERGRGAITIRDLFKASLRMRPDRLVIGEIRGGEALDLIQAMTSGHGGCLATVHATYPRDTLNRLETMALMGGVELPLSALRAQLASAIDIVVQTARMRDGRRMVTHIAEVCGTNKASGYRLRELFAVRQSAAGSHAGREFELVPTGVLPECLDLLRTHGWDLPTGVHDASRRGPAPESAEGQ